MKKIILTFVFASALTTMSAQTETAQTKDVPLENNYNKWSIELAGGLINFIPLVLNITDQSLNFKERNTDVRLIFIEEPEVFLHPEYQKEIPKISKVTVQLTKIAPPVNGDIGSVSVISTIS